MSLRSTPNTLLNGGYGGSTTTRALSEVKYKYGSDGYWSVLSQLAVY